MTTTVSNAPLSNYDVASDVVGGAQYQYVKLVDPSAGGTAPVNVATEATLAAFVSGENMTDFSNSVAAIQTNTGAMAGDITGPNGSTLDELNGLLTVRVEEGATYTYIGHATPGADESVAEWRIKRMTNANLTILFADGDVNFDNVWDDRASLTYL